MLGKSVKLIIILLFFIFTGFQSCAISKKKQGAIVYSFDDQYIDEWYKYRELFIRNHIKATFFINRPQLLDSVKIAKLRLLEKDGHEIGCHGFNHLNVIGYKDSIDILVKKEILPAIECLKNLGFNPVSYAYPYGQSIPAIDSVLSNYFTILRQATSLVSH